MPAPRLRPRFAAGGWSRRLGLLLGMVLVGFGIGVFTHALKEPGELQAWFSGEVGFFSASGPFLGIGFAVFYTVCIWSACLAAMRFALERFPLRRGRDLALHVGLIGAASAGTFFVLYALDTNICHWLGLGHEVNDPPLTLLLSITFVMTLIISALTYAFAFYRRFRDAEQAATQSELRALRAQVNPHFLFNALNSIAALIRLRPAEAEDVTTQLADLFRYTLQASRRPAVTLADEVEATELYLAIERARFRDRLCVQFDIPRTLLHAEVPSLLLQPLVENAVKHGVAQTEAPVAVSVEARAHEGGVCLSVRDTGPGFSGDDLEVVLRRGTGLSNVRDRLRLFFGAGAELHLLPDGVELCFPYRPATPPSGDGYASTTPLFEKALPEVHT